MITKSSERTQINCNMVYHFNFATASSLNSLYCHPEYIKLPEQLSGYTESIMQWISSMVMSKCGD